jgi:hypothetical protein
MRDAAARLRHDLGRSIRFSAPGGVEPDTEALRERLARDVLATRAGPGGPVAAAEVFDSWRDEEGKAFPPTGPLAEAVEGLAEAVRPLRRLPPGLEGLTRAELERLDARTRDIAAQCRRLSELAAADPGDAL